MLTIIEAELDKLYSENRIINNEYIFHLFIILFNKVTINLR